MDAVEGGRRESAGGQEWKERTDWLKKQSMTSILYVCPLGFKSELKNLQETTKNAHFNVNNPHNNYLVLLHVCWWYTGIRFLF